MSNGDEVLDNWEEIDEVGLTNTLQKIQQKQQITQQQQEIDSAKPCSKLPNTLSGGAITSLVDPKQFTLSNVDFSIPTVTATVPMKLLQRNANHTTNTTTGGSNESVTADGISVGATDLKSSPLDDMTASFQPVMMLLNKPADEYQSTTYATPTNLQTVKILRRPTQSMEPRNNDIKPRQPIKTLQQREQEYAEARLRILGSAKNPEDDVGGGSTNSTPSTNASVNTVSSTNNTTKGSIVSSPKVNPGINGGVVGGVGSSGLGSGSSLNLYNNSYNHNQQQQQQTNYYFMQQHKQQQQSLQKIPPAYNNRSMSGLLPLPALATTLQQQTHQHAQTQTSQTATAPHNQTWSPVVGGSVSSSALRHTQQQESILRLPNGPDGSAGFQMRR
ncbi:PAN2-PAN3 deadenylation complex subunit pan3 [Eurosta solidaginis]|uniref:PAN2-PAN3 deadenylation complex subunit pan3 n=1 Tax=Eurosta solidaginis TaxID=178769 RepID=UPI0035314CCA